MPWTALAVGLASGLASGAMGMASARQQQHATEEAYRKRHQWQVADLRSAGLNPVLSATQGAGSVGSMATGQTPDVGSSINSAAQSMLAREQATTAKTTQVQQLTQADVNEATAAHQAASAREASARADVAESVAAAYRSSPGLAVQKAYSDAGLSANSATGSVWRFGKHLDDASHSLFSPTSSARDVKYYDGGNIDAVRSSSSAKPRRARYPVRY